MIVRHCIMNCVKYLEDLCNSVNQHLPNDQGMKCWYLQWVKDAFKAQDKPMPFSVT